MPRDDLALFPALAFLESRAAQRHGEAVARDLRAACEAAYDHAHAEVHERGWRDYACAMEVSIPDMLAAVVPVAKWIGVAAVGGVIGNTTHDLLKMALRRRQEAQPLTAEESRALAEVAIRVRCHELGLSQPHPDYLIHHQYQAADGRWLLSYRDDEGRQFFVRIPPGRPNDDDLRLDVFVPSAPLGRRREWEYMDEIGRERLP